MTALARSLWSKPYLLLTLTMLMWGGNAVASRLAVDHVSPMALTTLRWGGVCIILPLLFPRQMIENWPVVRAHWRRVLIMGCLGFTAFNALMYQAAASTSAINIGIIQGAIPVFVLIGALAAFGSRATPMQLVGVAATLAGVTVVAARGDPATLATLAVSQGDVMMVVACMLYAGYTVGLRDRPPVPGIVFFAAMAAAALLFSGVLLAWEIHSGQILWPDRQGWLTVAYVTIGPSLLAQLTFMRGVELIGPGRAGVFVNLVPIFAALLAVLILGEPFARFHALALALVLGGIWLAERRRG